MKLHLATLALAVMGLFVTAGLLQSHLDVYAGGLAEGFFCGAVDGGTGCNQVAAHPSSWFLRYPVPVWGFMYYVAIFGLALAAAVFRDPDRKAFVAFGMLFSIAALLFDAYLGWIMATRVGALCIDCVATYAVNVLLFLCFFALDRRSNDVPLHWGRLLPSWRGARDGGDAGYFCNLVKAGGLVTGFVIMLTTFVLVVRPFSDVSKQGGLKVQELMMRLMQEEPDVDVARFEDQPSLGPDEALVWVAVVGDFQCIFCRSIAQTLGTLHEQWPDDLRVYFVNSPVSSKCNPAITEDLHPDACWLARAGECAGEQDRFWPFHDYLYRTLPFPRVDQEHVSDRLGDVGLDEDVFLACMASPRPGTALEGDIALCGDLGLTATPSLVINGFTTKGAFPPFALLNLLETMLYRVQELKDGGR